MSRSKAGLQVSLGVMLAIPLVVCAEEGAVVRISGAAAAPVASRLELAAAIGIIPTAPEAEKKPEVPVQPVEAAPPPVAQQEEVSLPEEEGPPEESEGVTRTQILLGVGVAALLGALGGGGGGGSSSTPSH